MFNVKKNDWMNKIDKTNIVKKKQPSFESSFRLIQSIGNVEESHIIIIIIEKHHLMDENEIPQNS